MAVNRIIFILLMIFSLGYSATGYAGQEAAVLEVGYGSRAMALGSAYVAHKPDASSLHWNPAALGFIQKSDLATMHTMLNTDASYYYAGGIFPNDYLNWGFSWVQIELADIPNTSATLNNNEVEVLKSLTYFENAETLGGGKKITDQLALGFNVKYISKKISNDYGEGYGKSLTLGLMYLISEDITLGLRADNLSNTQVYDTDTIEIYPPKYTLGFNFKLSDQLNLLLDATKRVDKNSYYEGRGGLEFLFNEHMQLMLGYDYDRFTAGASFALSSIYVDYAYAANNSYGLGSEQFVTLGVRW